MISDIEELRRYFRLEETAEELRKEIESEYTPYHSPNFSRITSGSSVRRVMDPVSSSMESRDRKRALLQKVEKERDCLRDEIDDWLDTIEDPAAYTAAELWLSGICISEISRKVFHRNGNYSFAYLRDYIARNRERQEAGQ